MNEIFGFLRSDSNSTTNKQKKDDEISSEINGEETNLKSKIFSLRDERRKTFHRADRKILTDACCVYREQQKVETECRVSIIRGREIAQQAANSSMKTQMFDEIPHERKLSTSVVPTFDKSHSLLMAAHLSKSLMTRRCFSMIDSKNLFDSKKSFLKSIEEETPSSPSDFSSLSVRVRRQPNNIGHYGFQLAQDFHGKIFVSSIIDSLFCPNLNVADELININFQSKFDKLEQYHEFLNRLWHRSVDHLTIKVRRRLANFDKRQGNKRNFLPRSIDAPRSNSNYRSLICLSLTLHRNQITIFTFRIIIIEFSTGPIIQQRKR